MIEQIYNTYMQSHLSPDEIKHLLILVFQENDFDALTIRKLQEEGYICREGKGVTLTSKGLQYRDFLLVKLATFYSMSENVFKKYFENELSDLHTQLIQIKQMWRHVRAQRLELLNKLRQQGKDKASIRRDAQYKKLKKEQDALRTRMRHVQKEYNRKLSKCIRTLNNVFQQWNSTQGSQS